MSRAGRKIGKAHSTPKGWWTRVRDVQLTRLMNNGIKTKKIGIVMGASTAAIGNRVMKLRGKGVDIPRRNGYRKRPPQKREVMTKRCLTCRQDFETAERDIHSCPECHASGIFDGLVAAYA